MRPVALHLMGTKAPASESGRLKGPLRRSRRGRHELGLGYGVEAGFAQIEFVLELAEELIADAAFIAQSYGGLRRSPRERPTKRA
jgi:hypothetical protein